jgi:GT2 family glycosyltransferase
MEKPIVFIPVHNDFEYFRATIESIMNSTNYPFRLLIIESESTDGSKEYSDALPFLYPERDIEIIHTKKEGPLRACQQAFEIAIERKCDLFLTQTDVIFPKLFRRDWFDLLVNGKNFPDCGMVTCLNGGGSSNDYLDGVRFVGTWCMYIPFNTLNKIGKLDENYEFGVGIDVDYTYRVVSSGLSIYFSNFWVDHHHLTAHVNEDRLDIKEIKNRSIEYFRRKYGKGDNRNPSP